MLLLPYLFAKNFQFHYRDFGLLKNPLLMEVSDLLFSDPTLNSVLDKSTSKE